MRVWGIGLSKRGPGVRGQGPGKQEGERTFDRSRRVAPHFGLPECEPRSCLRSKGRAKRSKSNEFERSSWGVSRNTGPVWAELIAFPASYG